MTLYGYGDPIKYFDVVDSSGVDQALTKRLGYAKVFVVGKDVLVKNAVDSEGKACIVASRNPQTILRASRSRSVVGVVFDDAELLKKNLEELRDGEKLLVIPACYLFADDQRTRQRNLYRVRKLYKNAKRVGVGMAIASMARSKEYLLSAAQMAELAKYIGASDSDAKKMVYSIGACIDGVTR